MVYLALVRYLINVALRKESVDRNIRNTPALLGNSQSLSARRAWIEICLPIELSRGWVVALRKESVDRNLVSCIDRTIDIVALRKESVDRNRSTHNTSMYACVALRKESVDRNYAANAVDQILPGRSPQGERG